MTDMKEQAVQALQRAGVKNTNDSGLTSALTGIGYAIVYLGDVIKGDRNKYEPPF